MGRLTKHARHACCHLSLCCHLNLCCHLGLCYPLSLCCQLGFCCHFGPCRHPSFCCHFGPCRHPSFCCHFGPCRHLGAFPPPQPPPWTQEGGGAEGGEAVVLSAKERMEALRLMLQHVRDLDALMPVLQRQVRGGVRGGATPWLPPAAQCYGAHPLPHRPSRLQCSTTLHASYLPSVMLRTPCRTGRPACSAAPRCMPLTFPVLCCAPLAAQAVPPSVQHHAACPWLHSVVLPDPFAAQADRLQRSVNDQEVRIESMVHVLRTLEDILRNREPNTILNMAPARRPVRRCVRVVHVARVMGGRACMVHGVRVGMCVVHGAHMVHMMRGACMHGVRVGM